eukprot:5656818-Lingulodinium_polyedra.AAC.1
MEAGFEACLVACGADASADRSGLRAVDPQLASALTASVAGEVATSLYEATSRRITFDASS